MKNLCLLIMSTFLFNSALASKIDLKNDPRVEKVLAGPKNAEYFKFLREANETNDKYQLRELNGTLIKELEEEIVHMFVLEISLVIALIILIILVFLIIRFSRMKKRSILFQKELHHRIKNNLGIIDNFIDVAISKTQDQNSKVSLEDLRNRVYSIYAVHEHVYNSKEEDEIELSTYTDELISHIREIAGRENISVQNIVPEKMQFGAEKTYVLGLIINEFLTNAFKHAFPEKESGDINIFMNEKDDSYSLKMSDSGKGLSNIKDLNKGKSYGLKLMYMLTQQLGGKLEAINNPGLELLITLPK